MKFTYLYLPSRMYKRASSLYLKAQPAELITNYPARDNRSMSTYYVFVKENFYRPVRIEANNIEDAVDAVAEDKGELLSLEHHSTGHWTEWLVEAPSGVRYYHAIGIGYIRL